MMKKINWIMIFVVALALAACGGAGVEEGSVESGDVETAVTTNTATTDTQSEASDNNNEPVQPTAKAVSNDAASLETNGDDGLSVLAQLALGTVQLEESGYPVDEAQAAELLPIWQALQSLSASDTTAAAEVNAVVNQIQDMMTPEQIQAINGMALTQESITAMIEEGGGAFGRGPGGGGNGEAGGRPPGGGLPGGGGQGRGQGGDLGAIDQDALATRRAERFGDGDPAAAFQDQMLMGAVIRSLAEKAGVQTAVDNFRGGGIYAIISETSGIDIETLRAGAAEGQTLVEIIEANGGDITAVEAALMEALAETPLPEGQDLETYIEEVLNGTFSGRPQE